MDTRSSHINRVGKRFFSAFSILIFCLTILTPMVVSSEETIEINASKVVRKISPLLMGGNIPGWDIVSGEVSPDAMMKLKNLKSSIYRFPGGLVSDIYHWKYGVGPQKERKKNGIIADMLPFRKGYVSSRVGIDEFVKFCDTVNADTLITVNCGTGTDQEAADWVEYCNGDINTKYGRLRAENGNSEPYDIKYWEVGNELYGAWNPKQMTASAYAKKFIAFSTAMKKRDPEIKLGITAGLTNQHIKWTMQVIKIVKNHADYIAFHIYYPREAGQELNDEDFAKAVMAIPELVNKQLQMVMNQSAVKGYKLQIAFTEFNIQYSQKKGRHSKNETRDLKSALSLSELYQTFAKNDVFMGNIWDLHSNTNLTLIKIDNTRLSPSYYAMGLYTNDFGRNIVESKVEGEPWLAINLINSKRAIIKQKSALSCLTTLSDDGKYMYLMVINKDTKNAIETSIIFHDFKAKEDIKKWTLGGLGAYDTNDVDKEIITTQNASVKRLTSSKILLHFPSLSITKIKLERRD